VFCITKSDEHLTHTKLREIFARSFELQKVNIVIAIINDKNIYFSVNLYIWLFILKNKQRDETNCQILIKKTIGGTENPETYRKIGLLSVSVSVWYRNELR
jgi:hypothetical protein